MATNKTVEYHLPCAVEAAWQALPAALQQLYPNRPLEVVPQQGRVGFSEGTNALSWGYSGSAQLTPHPNAGSTLTISMKLHFGLYDWGQRKRAAAKIYETIWGLLARHGQLGGPGG